MAFTTEAMPTPINSKPDNQPNQFDLPAKEFIGYDTNGTTTITGSPVVRENVKQEHTLEGDSGPIQVEPPKEESVTLSPQISALARKEQAQRSREQALKKREAEFASKLADADKYAQLQAKIKAKDFSAAEEMGMTYDEHVQYLLNKKAAENPEEQRYRNLEERQKALEKAQEDKTIQEYQANQALWKQEISKLIKDNDAFSTIQELKAEDMVLRHINDSFDEDGVELSADQAAQEIEEALIQRAEKFASVTKIKQKFSEPVKTLGPPKTSPKTITQNMTVTSQKSASKPFHLLSESEQLAEAIRRVNEAKLAQR